MYRAVYVDCQAVRADANFGTARGRKVVSLLKDYVTHLREKCFPYEPWGGNAGRAFDEAFGVAPAAREKADLANDATIMLFHQERVFLLTTSNGEFVAGCTTRLRSGTAAKKRPTEIDSVCVSPAHRGKGACKQLISAVAKFYLDAKDDVVIVCEPGNPAACRCYASVFEKSRLPAKGPYRKFWGIRESALPSRGPTRVA